MQLVRPDDPLGLGGPASPLTTCAVCGKNTLADLRNEGGETRRLNFGEIFRAQPSSPLFISVSLARVPRGHPTMLIQIGLFFSFLFFDIRAHVNDGDCILIGC